MAGEKVLIVIDVCPLHEVQNGAGGPYYRYALSKDRNAQTAPGDRSGAPGSSAGFPAAGAPWLSALPREWHATEVVMWVTEGLLGPCLTLPGPSPERA